MEPKEISDYVISKLETVYETSEARSMCRLLMEESFGLSTADIIVNNDLALDERKKEELEIVLDRLLAFEPIQHILGFAWFMGDRFMVNKHVLIPRQETEELIHLIANENQSVNPVILDIGTGSGCIPIGLKKLIPKADIHASEVSLEAVEVASSNAQTLNYPVSFYQSDILSEFPPIDNLDVIVSNPPYVTESEKDQMNWNVLNHEPELALFVPDIDPLIFYQKIAAWSRAKLKSDGKLYFEINEAYGFECRKLVEETGFKEVRLIKDINGKDRFVVGRN